MLTNIVIGLVIILIMYIIYKVVMSQLKQREEDKCCGACCSAEKDSDPFEDEKAEVPALQPLTKPPTAVVDQRHVPTDRIVKAISKKIETERFVSDDEIKFRAYMIASADGFKGDAQEYWIQAEKELKGGK